MESFSEKFRSIPNEKVKLKALDTAFNDGIKKKKAQEALEKSREKLAVIQEKFWADDRYSLLIIFQAPDAAGKDGAIRHVMSGLNPQGCRVYSYKAPTRMELEHNYLWRHYRDLPERGMIGIFNRSHYENVLATRVNPAFLLNERLPDIDTPEKADNKFWNSRFEQINNFEKTLHQNGCRVIKFFLHLSKDEQKERLLERLNDKDKNWKFSSDDLAARAQWDAYHKAYEEMIEKTSTDYAPWFIIPADKKYFARMAISEIIIEQLEKLELRYPKGESDEMLEKAKAVLLNEK